MDQPLDIATVAFMLFLIMDPVGNVPVFLSLLSQVAPARRRWIVARELVFALVVLLGFLFLGQPLLDLLHLEQESISIAGGIVLFIIALRMIFPSGAHTSADELDGEPFLVPLAVPLIAGPSTIAALLLLGRSAPAQTLDILAALLLAWAASLVILLASGVFFRILGQRVLVALERLMGMLLVTMAVQMFLNGVRGVLSMQAGGA